MQVRRSSLVALIALCCLVSLQLAGCKSDASDANDKDSGSANDDAGPGGKAGSGGSNAGSGGSAAGSGSSGSNGGADAGVDAASGDDDDAGEPYECDVDVSGVDGARVAGLTKAMQLWKFSKEKSGDTLTDIPSECDRSIAYRVGPELIVKGTKHDYAECVIAKNGFIELSAGNLGQPSGCPELGCSGKMGVVWNTETSGSVFALDSVTGKPKGAPAFYLVLYGVLGDPYVHLVLSGNGSGQNGTLMDARLGDTSVLQCQ